MEDPLDLERMLRSMDMHRSSLVDRLLGGLGVLLVRLGWWRERNWDSEGWVVGGSF